MSRSTIITVGSYSSLNLFGRILGRFQYILTFVCTNFDILHRFRHFANISPFCTDFDIFYRFSSSTVQHAKYTGNGLRGDEKYKIVIERLINRGEVTFLEVLNELVLAGIKRSGVDLIKGRHLGYRYLNLFVLPHSI